MVPVLMFGDSNWTGGFRSGNTGVTTVDTLEGFQSSISTPPSLFVDHFFCFPFTQIDSVGFVLFFVKSSRNLVGLDLGHIFFSLRLIVFLCPCNSVGLCCGDRVGFDQIRVSVRFPVQFSVFVDAAMRAWMRSSVWSLSFRVRIWNRYRY
jgi:hypothetical protein